MFPWIAMLVAIGFMGAAGWRVVGADRLGGRGNDRVRWGGCAVDGCWQAWSVVVGSEPVVDEGDFLREAVNGYGRLTPALAQSTSPDSQLHMPLPSIVWRTVS